MSLREHAAARAEYLARIHRVMDHIERHLGESLALADLARVACFSPFHFHRIFTAVSGESLYQFILRLRLEKAATQLVGSPRKSITSVALDCGFGSSASFARSFKGAFGVSASEWRSKKCNTLRKDGEELAGQGGYDADLLGAHSGAREANPWRSSMSPKSPESLPCKEARQTRIETIQPLQVAYVRHVGPYAGDAALFGRLFGKLFAWAGPRDLVRPQTKTLTVYHDNPEITAQEKLRISVCITVPAGTRGEGEVGTMEIPAGKYAVATFELAASEFGAAWNWLMGVWLPASGFEPDERPCFELCLNDPEAHPEKKHLVEIWEPVRPLQR